MNRGLLLGGLGVVAIGAAVAIYFAVADGGKSGGPSPQAGPAGAPSTGPVAGAPSPAPTPAPSPAGKPEDKKMPDAKPAGDKFTVQEREKLFWKSMEEQPFIALKRGEATGDDTESLVMKNYRVTVDLSKMPGVSDPPPPIELSIGEINVKRMDWSRQKGGSAPRWADIVFKDFVIPLTKVPPQAGMFLRMVGIQELKLDGVYRYTFDEESKTLTIQSVSLDMKELAVFSIEAKFNDFDVNKMQQNSGGDPTNNQQQIAEAISKASIAGFKVVLENKGLAEKVLNTVAAFQGGDVEKFRAQLIQQMEARLSQASSELEKEAFGAAIAFLKKPGTITIQGAPSAPVPMTELDATKGSPDALKQKLNLTIKAE